MKLRIRLENFKGVFARMWFNIAMTSDRLSFASVEIDKSYSFPLLPWKNLCHRWSRDQPRPGSLFPTTREVEERDPGNEVDSSSVSDKPLGTARLPIPKCIRNETLLKSKCIVDQNIARQREPGLTLVVPG